MLAQTKNMMTKQPAHPFVMVVDDEPSVRHLVRRMLEPAGYHVIEAGDGVEACAAIAGKDHLDLLIADFMMPQLTGAEVARRFRIAKPNVKVLFITGFVDGLFDERAALWEDEAFLEKPFNRDGLLEAVSLLLFGRVKDELSPAPQLATTGGV